MTFLHGGVVVSTRDTLHFDRWLLIVMGEIVASGRFTEYETLTVFPGGELAIHPDANKVLQRSLLPHSRGVIFTYGKGGYRTPPAERDEPSSSPK